MGKAQFPLAGNRWLENLRREVEEDRPAIQVELKQKEDYARWVQVLAYMVNEDNRRSKKS